ncbi:jg26036 [Pararge aegeria aegeria]|uniref:Jg26036 protein n=1 Tax=Pararge aegeria aegeria TaxID=348720 RepID=A0A8S4QRV0_9NEOP|nr:jg26036 [Pararge aegeria aegeria]
MMSDDDRDIDIESDAENDSDSRPHARNSLGGSGYYSQVILIIPMTYDLLSRNRFFFYRFCFEYFEVKN